MAHVYDKTGPLEAYAKQTQNGLMLGLEYATQGTMTVAGRKIRVIEKDNRASPTWRARSWLGLCRRQRRHRRRPHVSGVALAMLPIAEEYEKILLVEPAVADSITGDKWNKYIFRTGRNSSQDAIANAVAFDQKARRSPCWRRTMPSAATA